MNPFAVAGGEVWTFTVPLKSPFVTALGSKTQTTNAALRLRLKGGAEGYGEASSSIVIKRLSPETLARSLRGLLTRLRGRDVREIEPLAADIWRLCPDANAAAAAVECAALEALLAARAIPMAEWFGGAQDSIETDLTISAWPPRQAAEGALAALKQGFRTLKIKVGTSDKAEDLKRVEAVSRAAARLGRRITLILDGNQGFHAEGALRFAERALRLGAAVALFEQPLERGKLKEAAWLSRRSPVPLAADESVRSPAEALEVLWAGAAEVVNIKVAKLGLRRSLDVAALARAAGKGLMIGCMQESARGLSPSVHLACGLGVFSYADLDSDVLLDEGRGHGAAVLGGRPFSFPGEGQPRGGFTREGPILRL
ncbi:MAG: dipeptide epimerase [Elusimicrobia bacterium]|nr:dipeptide epimerase [Elusimicrobiota bacterium]